MLQGDKIYLVVSRFVCHPLIGAHYCTSQTVPVKIRLQPRRRQFRTCLKISLYVFNPPTVCFTIVSRAEGQQDPSRFRSHVVYSVQVQPFIPLHLHLQQKRRLMGIVLSPPGGCGCGPVADVDFCEKGAVDESGRSLLIDTLGRLLGEVLEFQWMLVLGRVMLVSTASLILY